MKLKYQILAFTLILIFAACNSNNEKDLKSQIVELEKQLPNAQNTFALVELYKSYFEKFPDDTINASQLVKVASYYLKNTEKIDSASYFLNQIFTKYPNSKQASFAMLNFAGVQKTTADQLHWLDQTHQKFPQTQEGEQALLTKAITYENNAMPDEALKIYEEYLVMYPNSKFKDDVQLSIKNIGKSPEELVKEFEANRKKPN